MIVQRPPEQNKQVLEALDAAWTETLAGPPLYPGAGHMPVARL
jgi:hypothetical protein